MFWCSQLLAVSKLWLDDLVGGLVAVCGVVLAWSLLQLYRSLRNAHQTRNRIIDTLRQSELKFRTLTEATSASIFMWRGTKHIFVNSTMVETLGYSQRELLTMNFWETIHPECRDSVKQTGLSRMHGGIVPNRYETRVLTKNGEERWVDLSVRAIELDGEKVVVGTGFDITDRKQAEDDRSRLAAIVEHSEDAIFSLERSGKIISWNQGAENMFGLRPQDVLGSSVTVLVPPNSADFLSRHVQGVTQGQPTHHFESVYVRNETDSIVVSQTISPIKDSANQVVGVSIIARDVSHTRRLERELLDVASHEQQRIGRELHDSLGQELTGLSYLCRSLQTKLEAKSLSEAESAGTIVSGIQRAIGVVRSAVDGLAPVEVDASGLRVALQQLVTQTSQSCDIDCRLECPNEIMLEDNVVATHIYRITQEAVNNAVKHSQAKQIIVSPKREDGHLTVSIRDDGVGIPTQEEQPGGFGLKIMRYRARAVDGTFDIRAGDDGGTVVSCRIAIER